MEGTVEVREILAREGYRRMESNLEQFSLYYKTEQEQVRGILLVEMDVMPEVCLEQMKHIHGQVYQALQRMGENPILLTLAAGAQIVRFRGILTGLPACWLWDTGSRRLIIYENQPPVFFGLERLLENVEETGASARDTMPDRRKRSPVSGRTWAVVNTLIVIINVLVFFVMELFGSTEDAQYMLEHGAAFAPWIAQNGEYYRLFTSMFLHFGITHLGNNMLVLFLLGDNVERAVGKWKYLVLYILSGLGGSMVSYLHAKGTGEYAVSAGASGAIFGVIGALFYIVAVNHGRLEDMTTRRLGIMIAVSLYHGFTSAGVDNYAHLGGLAAGILLAVVLYRKKGKEGDM